MLPYLHLAAAGRSVEKVRGASALTTIGRPTSPTRISLAERIALFPMLMGSNACRVHPDPRTWSPGFSVVRSPRRVY